MTSKERYKELIKENNQSISYLSDSYKKIADIYTKKARGFGVKSLDTEVKIKKVLEELILYDEKHIDVNIAIPNMTIYIEENVQLISKAPSIKFKIQEIVAVTLLIAGIVGYFILNKACSKPVTLNDVEKESIRITVNNNEDNSLYLEWKANNYAQNGYTLKVYTNDTLIKEFIVPKQIKDASDEYVGTQYFQTDIVYLDTIIYTFEIIVNRTTDFEQSNPVKVTYPSET